MKYREGFPLDSLSVQIESMKYYYDIKDGKGENLGVILGFRDFFLRSLNEYMGNFTEGSSINRIG
jgi:hypothetical protein